MNPQAIPTQGPGLDLGDIYYVLFRHKWKILLCTAAGLLTAFAIYQSESPPYQSEAKLLVRYIISESKSTGPNNNNATAKMMPDERGASIMNTEQEILSSVNLAQDVVKAIGPEKLLAKYGGGKEPGEATSLIKAGLTVYVAQGSSVINLVFRHRDPELVEPVLREIIDRYLKLHVETHRAAGMLGDALAQEADSLRSRLITTEDDLRKEINKSNVISLESAKEEFGNRMVVIRRDISNYEAELAGRIAIYEDIRKRRPSLIASTGEKPAAEPEPDIPLSVLDELKTVTARVNRMQTMEQDLLLQFTPESARVKEIRVQRVEAEEALQKIREQYPALTKFRAAANEPGGPDAEAKEASTAWLQITSYQAKIKELNSQLDRMRTEAAKLDQAEGKILELRRRKEIEEANYRYYAANLEQAKISQQLGNGKVSNITQIQSPSPAYRSQMNFKKVGISAAAGIITGLLWAFLIELYLDRSIRRPVDLQRLLRVPLFLSIPRLKLNGAKKSLAAGNSLALPEGESTRRTATVENEVETTPERSPGSPLQLFHETLRDRLIGYFEGKNLTHKPKLVAITGLRSAAGVTTTAAGLARSLSETNEGNVLLVDMTLGQGAAQQFTKGRATCGLDDLLEARNQAHVHENLYVVSETTNSERLSRNLPQRFSKLVPKLKASDFDYIIFDMPTVSQLSITPRLAGFMDMVLLVIESEKTDREIVQSACALLAESKAHVGVVLNKTRAYVPGVLQQQLMVG